MIQTPILDGAFQSPKKITTVTSHTHSYSSGQKQGSNSTNLRERLDSQRNSQNLSLLDLFLGDEGAHELADFLRQNKEYVTIQLRGNNISGIGFEAICQALKGFPHLRELSAEWNNIGSDSCGLSALHQLVKSSSSIEFIDIKNNRIGPNCARVVSDIVKDSNSLRKMDLRWNELGEEGGRQILEALQVSRKQISLDLSGNRIPEHILTQINQAGSSGGSLASPKVSIFDKKETTIGSRDRVVYTQVSREEADKLRNISNQASYRTDTHVISGDALPSKYSSNFDIDNAGSKKIFSSAKKVSEISTGLPEVVHKSENIGTKYSLYNSSIQTHSHRTGFDENFRSPVKTDTNTVVTKVYKYSPVQIETQEPRMIVADVPQETASFGERNIHVHRVHSHSPARHYESKHDINIDDVNSHIEETQKNIERYSPTSKRNGATKFTYEFKQEASNRPTSQVHQDLGKRIETRVYTANVVKDDRPPVHVLQSDHSIATQATTPLIETREVITRPIELNHGHEVKHIVHHEVDSGGLKVGKLISDLERIAEVEGQRASQAEARLLEITRQLENEQAIRYEVEKKHSYIIEELRRRDIEVNELRVKVDSLLQENLGLKNDNSILHTENKRLDDFNKAGLAEIEDKYRHQLEDADAQTNTLHQHLRTVEHELNCQIRDMRRDFESRCRQYDNQIRELNKVNDDLSNELASQIEYTERLKIEHEANINKVANQVREEEIHKAQTFIRGLEEELRSYKFTNEKLTAENNEMLADLRSYEKQMRDQHLQFANELNRLGDEIDRLRNELANANGIINQQNSELSARQNVISRLEGEIDRLNRELQRISDIHASQIESIQRDFEHERRRFAENERQLILKIQDLEKTLVDAQNETIRVTKEYDRLVQVMQGNVSKAIHEAFVTHKPTAEVRYIEPRGIPVTRSIIEERPIVTSTRMYNSAEKKYF